MKLTRTELREKIMIILYQIDFYKKENLDFDIKKVIKENVEIENEFVNSIVYGVFEKVDEIDNLIGKYIKIGI
jgi:transcription termination factor NusB